MDLLVRRGVLVVSSVFFAVLVALVLIAAVQPVYTGTSKVLVEPALSPGGSPPAARLSLSDAVLARALTLAAPFEPADIAAGVAFRPEFLAFFRIHPGAGPSEGTTAMVLLRQATRVERMGAGEAVVISARAMSPEGAARFADALTRAYIEAEHGMQYDVQLVARRLVERALAENARQMRAGDLAVHALHLTMTSMAGEGKSELAARLAAAQGRSALALRQHEVLAARLAELDAEMAPQMERRGLAAASASSDGGFPHGGVFLASAVPAGLAVGLILSLLLEGLARGVRSKDDLAVLSGVSVAAGLPRRRGPGFEGTSLADLVVTGPETDFARRVSLLCGALENGHARLIGVTSSGRGEGTTTVALSLARAFASAGRSTVLIDADTRSAGLRRHVDVPLAAGLEQVLEGKVDIARLAGMLRRDPRSGLWILASSDISTVPAAQLFDTPTFSGLLRAMRSSFDVVVVDMPSLPAADAQLVLPHMDAAVLVARWGQARPPQLRAAIDLMRGAVSGAAAILPVLNREPPEIDWGRLVPWPGPRARAAATL